MRFLYGQFPFDIDLCMPTSPFYPGRIAAACKEANLSHQELCLQLGLAKEHTFEDLVAGNVPLTQEMLVALSELLSIELSDLLSPFKLCPQLLPFFEQEQIPQAPYSGEFLQALFVALDRGQMSARKAARLLGVSLYDLGQAFTSRGIPSPFAL